MKDNRGREIKNLLIKLFPEGKFSVRVNKYSMGESFAIQTDLVNSGWRECWKCGKKLNSGIIWCPECRIETVRKNPTDEIRQQIEAAVKKWESVDYDQATGEILSGGNTYVFVNPYGDWKGGRA